MAGGGLFQLVQLDDNISRYLMYTLLNNSDVQIEHNYEMIRFTIYGGQRLHIVHI